MDMPEPRRPGAVRLIFEYEGREVRLVSRDPVDALAPPTDQLDGYEDHLGVWAEVRDADGRALHRRVLAGEVDDTVEVFGDASGPSLRREPVTEARRGFAVLVPALDGADHVAFLRGTGADRSLAATELARFPLAGEA